MMRSDLSSYFEEPDFKQLIAKYEGMVKNHTPIYFDTDELTDLADYYIYIGKETEAEPYVNEGSTVISDNTISFIGSSNANRIRTSVNGEAIEYWTRTPNVGYTNYVFTVQVDGKLSGFNTLSEENGILIMISV